MGFYAATRPRTPGNYDRRLDCLLEATARSAKRQIQRAKVADESVLVTALEKSSGARAQQVARQLLILREPGSPRKRIDARIE